jgi:hypothetical protein
MKFLILTVCALFLGSDIVHTKTANEQVQRGLTLAEQVYNVDNPVQARSNLIVEKQNLVDGETGLSVPLLRGWCCRLLVKGEAIPLQGSLPSVTQR